MLLCYKNGSEVALPSRTDGATKAAKVHNVRDNLVKCSKGVQGSLDGTS